MFPKAIPASALRRCFKTLTFTFLALIAHSTPLRAGLPTDQVKETIDKMVAILDDPVLKGPDNLDKKKELIGKAADERIDWYALCQRCLGRHWRQRTAEEKALFVSTLTRFLKINYTDIIVDNFGDLKEIVYYDESIDEKYALVKVKLVTRNNLETPIFYRLKSNSDRTDWEVIDIVIEGASMVKIYRIQFDDILRNGSFNEVIEKIEAKIAEVNIEAEAQESL